MLNDKPCILIADDEPNVCRIAKLIISPNDFDVLTAENGLDAFEKVIKFQPVLVFSDILMPKCDGFELCHKIKTTPTVQHIPFIFLTGLDKQQFKSRLVEVNANDYLMKPFSSENMNAMIAKWAKKPVIHSEHSVQPIQKSTNHATFQFGNPNIDHQLCGEIEPQSFVLVSGPIGSGTSRLSREFTLDGIKKEQLTMLISFETPKHRLAPMFNLNESQKKFLHYCDASRWTAIDSKPWRNIDYIFDTIASECARRSYERIVFDSFSHGFAFWSLIDILRFIDCCRSLPNNEHQCLLWTINAHPQHQDLEYHLQHVMDIGIQMTPSGFSPQVIYSKWQSPMTADPHQDSTSTAQPA